MDDTSGSESQETIQRTSESEETMGDSSEEEIGYVDLPMIRQKLRESGVIVRVLDDFMPCMLLQVIYDDTVITLGDRLRLSRVQTEPDVEGYGDDAVPESVDTGAFIMVMTHLEPAGGEYLHELCVRSVIGHERADIDAPWVKLIDHEPPRTAGRMIVFTLFTASADQNIYLPSARENFSTRDFARRNALGPPVTAAFFYIRLENENDGDGGNDSPRKDRNERPPQTKIDNALPAKPKDAREIYFKLLKRKEFRPTPVPSWLEKKTGDDGENDSATGTIRVTYYNLNKDNDSATWSDEQKSCKQQEYNSPGRQSDDE